jgi:hypothetical protein
MGTYAISTGYAYGGAAAGDVTNYIVCINTRNGLDNAVTPAAIYVSTGKAS